MRSGVELIAATSQPTKCTEIPRSDVSEREAGWRNAAHLHRGPNYDVYEKRVGSHLLFPRGCYDSSVFHGAIDGADGLAVWVFTPGQNSDVDWQRYCDAIRGAARAAFNHKSPFALQLIVAGSTDPPATWRKEIALATDEIGGAWTLGLVTGSVVVRGMLTAISWIRAPKYRVHMLATLDEAVALADIAVRGRGARARATVERLLTAPLPQSTRDK